VFGEHRVGALIRAVCMDLLGPAENPAVGSSEVGFLRTLREQLSFPLLTYTEAILQHQSSFNRLHGIISHKRTLQNHCCENLRSYITYVVCNLVDPDIECH
jgi:hypothetical protein